MGSSWSNPAFPVPRPYEPPHTAKSGKWTLSGSMKKLSKKGKDRGKYDDFILPKYPTPTAGMYGFPYYPQMQPAYPGYYAPVQMAIVQPIGVQQPMYPMPTTYVPMATYPTTAAPIQPAVVPATTAQRAPTMQMPAPAVQPAPVAQMPGPTTAPGPTPSFPQFPSVAPSSVRSQMPRPHPAHEPRSTASTQMPQPHPAHEPRSSASTQMPQLYLPSQGSARQPTPIISDPVIPPPPFTNSEPPRAMPDSGRLRLTDFYRPADLPPQSQRSNADEPVRPPTTGPPGRTPFVPSMQMPTPAPVSNNPLPPPPTNVWDTSPYRDVLRNLPNELPTFSDLPHRSDMLVDDPVSIPPPPSRFGGIFGGKDKGKKPLRGLFRSKSSSGYDSMPNEAGPSGRHRHGRTNTMTSIVIPPLGEPSMDMPEPNASSTSMPAPTYGPPIRFDHTGEFAGFVNHSNHRVMYKNKMYPTALHLLEAMKFTYQPNLQERIRTCKDVNDMYPLSASFQEHVRPDWGQVFLKIMEDVLYLKFKQHPVLRTLLLRTGIAEIIYADENSYWGEGTSGDGTNELGKALARVRERLRQEGET